MTAEEFVLIPRTVYIREQPEIVQILEDPNVKNKATHISMLQRLQFKTTGGTKQFSRTGTVIQYIRKNIE